MTSPDLVLYNAFEKKDIGPKSYYDAVPKERKKLAMCLLFNHVHVLICTNKYLFN